MAIAPDISASADFGGGGSSPRTYAYTIGAVADPILWVAIRSDGGIVMDTAAWNTTETMTRVDTVAIDASTMFSLFVLANPTTGTHNVTVTFTGSSNLHHFTASYSGASAAGVPDAHKADQQTADPVTVSLTIVAGNSWLIGLSRDSGADAITVTSGATVIQSEGTHTRFYHAGPLSAGSNDVVIDQVASEQLGTLIASFAPAAAGGAPPPSPSLLLLGVGR